MKNILIVGGPRTGKTHFAHQIAEKLQIPAFSTDEWIDENDYGASAAAAAEAIVQHPDAGFVLEGVATVRALRSLLRDGILPPGLTIVYCGSAKVEQTPGQARMTKGLETIWNEIEPKLKAKGVKIYGRARFEHEYLGVRPEGNEASSPAVDPGAEADVSRPSDT